LNCQLGPASPTLRAKLRCTGAAAVAEGYPAFLIQQALLPLTPVAHNVYPMSNGLATGQMLVVNGGTVLV
jgi:hypothetical protein